MQPSEKNEIVVRTDKALTYLNLNIDILKLCTSYLFLKS